MSVISEFANIPNARLRSLGNRLKDIHIQKAKLAEEEREIRAEAVEQLGLGCYETMSVYKVRDTWVKRHHRDGYKAVRVRTGLTRKK